MSGSSWQSLWQDKKRQADWSVPAEDLILQLPVLTKANVKYVLDLGCGAGRHTRFLAEQGFQVTAVDTAESALALTSDSIKRASLKANVQKMDMVDLKRLRVQYDFILSWNVIYHATLTVLADVIEQIYQAVKPGGFVLLTLNSLRNQACGEGDEIEPGTFTHFQKLDRAEIHHYSDRQEVLTLLSSWEILSLKEKEMVQGGDRIPGSWHWIVFARKNY